MYLIGGATSKEPHVPCAKSQGVNRLQRPCSLSGVQLSKKVPQTPRKTQDFQAVQVQYLHPDRIIPQWPEEIRSRSRFGDWEGDTVYGAVGKGCLVTLVDRKSRLLRAAVIRSRSAEETQDTVVSLLRGLPVSSISFDNESEFAAFHDVEQQLNTLVYFAEPHKPWQRPTNENTNNLLRFFFPKGYDFLSLSQEDLDHAVRLINQKHRRCLDWRSPSELFPVALT